MWHTQFDFFRWKTYMYEHFPRNEGNWEWLNAFRRKYEKKDTAAVKSKENTWGKVMGRLEVLRRTGWWQREIGSLTNCTFCPPGGRCYLLGKTGSLSFFQDLMKVERESKWNLKELWGHCACPWPSQPAAGCSMFVQQWRAAANEQKLLT